MGFFSLTGDEGQYRPNCLARLFVFKQIKFSAEAQQNLNRFKGRADNEPSTLVLTMSKLKLIRVTRQLDHDYYQVLREIKEL